MSNVHTIKFVNISQILFLFVLLITKFVKTFLFEMKHENKSKSIRCPTTV